MCFALLILLLILLIFIVNQISKVFFHFGIELDATADNTEENQYKPSSPYSSSKASADLLVMSWGRTYNIPFLVTNCSNNYGPRQYLEKFIPTIISQLKNGKKVPVYGNGKQKRNWIFVKDNQQPNPCYLLTSTY